MQKTRKGMSKFFILLLIFAILIISAVVFGYSSGDTDEIKSQIKTKARSAIDEGGEKVVEKVIDEGREAVGERLVETGEKMLDEK